MSICTRLHINVHVTSMLARILDRARINCGERHEPLMQSAYVGNSSKRQPTLTTVGVNGCAWSAEVRVSSIRGVRDAFFLYSSCVAVASIFVSCYSVATCLLHAGGTDVEVCTADANVCIKEYQTNNTYMHADKKCKKRVP